MNGGFGFVHRELVRFRDLDGMGHVNNAVFSTYLEQARLAWFSRPPFGAADDDLPLTAVILARTEIDFRSPVAFEDGTIEIGVRPAALGTKSFELEYEPRARGRIVAEATSVLVGDDYDRAESVPISDRWRRRLSE